MRREVAMGSCRGCSGVERMQCGFAGTGGSPGEPVAGSARTSCLPVRQKRPGDAAANGRVCPPKQLSVLDNSQAWHATTMHDIEERGLQRGRHHSHCVPHTDVASWRTGRQERYTARQNGSYTANSSGQRTGRCPHGSHRATQ